jgi:hypothetical protein
MPNCWVFSSAARFTAYFSASTTSGSSNGGLVMLTSSTATTSDGITWTSSPAAFAAATWLPGICATL